LVREGEVIREDAPLLEVETDKAQVEIPSPMSGRVAKIHVEAGQTVKVGAVLVTFDDADGNGARGAAPMARKPDVATAPEAAPSARSGARVSPSSTAPVPATPATRRLARELGVDLHAVTPSGPGRRVTDDDVRAAASGAPREPDTSRTGGRAPAREPAPSRRGPAKPLATVGLEPPPLPSFEQFGPI